MIQYSLFFPNNKFNCPFSTHKTQYISFTNQHIFGKKTYPNKGAIVDIGSKEQNTYIDCLAQVQTDADERDLFFKQLENPYLVTHIIIIFNLKTSNCFDFYFINQTQRGHISLYVLIEPLINFGSTVPN